MPHRRRSYAPSDSSQPRQDPDVQLPRRTPPLSSRRSRHSLSKLLLPLSTRRSLRHRCARRASLLSRRCALSQDPPPEPLRADCPSRAAAHASGERRAGTAQHRRETHVRSRDDEEGALDGGSSDEGVVGMRGRMIKLYPYHQIWTRLVNTQRCLGMAPIFTSTYTFRQGIRMLESTIFLESITSARQRLNVEKEG